MAILNALDISYKQTIANNKAQMALFNSHILMMQNMHDQLANENIRIEKEHKKAIAMPTTEHTKSILKYIMGNATQAEIAQERGIDRSTLSKEFKHTIPALMANLAKAEQKLKRSTVNYHSFFDQENNGLQADQDEKDQQDQEALDEKIDAELLPIHTLHDRDAKAHQGNASGLAAGKIASLCVPENNLNNVILNNNRIKDNNLTTTPLQPPAPVKSNGEQTPEQLDHVTELSKSQRIAQILAQDPDDIIEHTPSDHLSNQTPLNHNDDLDDAERDYYNRNQSDTYFSEQLNNHSASPFNHNDSNANPYDHNENHEDYDNDDF